MKCLASKGCDHILSSISLACDKLLHLNRLCFAQLWQTAFITKAERVMNNVIYSVIFGSLFKIPKQIIYLY